MKITKQLLAQIIKEEIEHLLNGEGLKQIKEELQTTFHEARSGPAGAGGHHVPGAGRTGVSGHAGMGRKYARDRLSPEGLKNYWSRIFEKAGFSNEEALNKLVDNKISADMMLAGISASGPQRALRSWIYGPEMKPLLTWLNINQGKYSGYTQAGDIPGAPARGTVGGGTSGLATHEALERDKITEEQIKQFLEEEITAAKEARESYDHVLAALKRWPAGMLTRMMDDLKVSDPEKWADLMQMQSGEQQQLDLPEEGLKEDIELPETPDLFQMAEDLRNVADSFNPEEATVLKQAAEILHTESGVFE